MLRSKTISGDDLEAPLLSNEISKFNHFTFKPVTKPHTLTQWKRNVIHPIDVERGDVFVDIF